MLIIQNIENFRVHKDERSCSYSKMVVSILVNDDVDRGKQSSNSIKIIVKNFNLSIFITKYTMKYTILTVILKSSKRKKI